MAILDLSTPIPGETTQIVSRRATCQGMQYTIADILGCHTVTVNNGCIGCSCGLDRSFLTCEHIRIVEKQEQGYAQEAARRAAYSAAHDLSYGD